MQTVKIVHFGTVTPGADGDVEMYYRLDQEGYNILVNIFPEFADLFDYTYKGDGYYYAPYSDAIGNQNFQAVLQDENLSFFIGFVPFAKSNCPSELVG